MTPPPEECPEANPAVCHLLMTNMKADIVEMRTDIKDISRKISNGFAAEMSAIKTTQETQKQQLRIQWWFIAGGVMVGMGVVVKAFLMS